MIPTNFKEYIQRYDVERILFDEIGPCARDRKYLTFDEFFKICMWKSTRPKKQYLKNLKSSKSVEEVTKDAFKEESDINKIKTLCELKGVGIPTASAILTIVFPDKYAVIDIRCIEMLNSLEFKINKNLYSYKTWEEYLKIIRKIAKDEKITPRKVDMALFAMHREKLEEAGYQNLYSKQ